MEKIDRLGWAEGTSLVAWGARFGIRVNDGRHLSSLLQVLPVARETDAPVVQRLFSVRVAPPSSRPGTRHYHLLYVDHFPVIRTLDFGELLVALEWATRVFLAENARKRLFIHAGVVGIEDRAIVLPGRSMSGKTSLVAELLRQGASYWSDECAVLDEKGLVHPFPKPLSVREPGKEEQVNVAPRDFGAEVGDRPLPVGLVVVSRYKPGARWRPRTLSRGQALLALLKHTVAARRSPERSLAMLARTLERARVVRSPRGEARETASRILELLRATPVNAPS